ncbi:MAG: hypothetical protein JWP29_3126, partial [Rhodoferax sp.]|nr:hypothetical protein [Rhodoferax sp.]
MKNENTTAHGPLRLTLTASPATAAARPASPPHTRHTPRAGVALAALA